MALKATSSPIAISTQLVQGTANTFQVQSVDLQLNPLDQEVFVVTGVKIDFNNAPQLDPSLFATFANGLAQCSFELAVTKTRPATMPDISENITVAASKMITITGLDATPAPSALTTIEQNAMDTPPSTQDYLDIIATDNFFLAVDGSNASGVCTGNIRLFGYRAKADASTYAALVQSEMLSA